MVWHSCILNLTKLFVGCNVEGPVNGFLLSRSNSYPATALKSFCAWGAVLPHASRDALIVILTLYLFATEILLHVRLFHLSLTSWNDVRCS